MMNYTLIPYIYKSFKKLRHINQPQWAKKTLSKILCKWKQDSVVSLFLYLNSVFKHKHKLIHNQAPV